MSATGSQFCGTAKASLTAWGQKRGAEIQQVPSPREAARRRIFCKAAPIP